MLRISIARNTSNNKVKVQIKETNGRYEVLTEEILTIIIFWDLTHCCLVDVLNSSGGTYCNLDQDIGVFFRNMLNIHQTILRHMSENSKLQRMQS
jgi:hypothetical protein